MNSIKIGLITACLVFALSVSAQQKGQKQSKVERLTTSLDLSQEQAEEVEVLFKESREEKNAIRQNTELSAEDKKMALKSLKKNSTSKLEKVLTPEQLAKYNEMNAQRVKDKKERKATGKDPWQEELGLTDAQTLQMKTIKEKAKHERKAIQSNAELSQEEKREQLKKVRMQSEARLKEVLSKEQYKKMKEVKAEKRKAKKGNSEHSPKK